MRRIPSVQLVANPTIRRWSQAYSTLNLYIVLHMGGDDVARVGRDTLEQMQREYFALDGKDLTSIKAAVTTVVSEIAPERDYSLTLVTIVENTVYIVVANCGKVVILRGARFGVVAEGVEGNVEAYSGRLLPDDVLILGTCDFFEKITREKLSAIESRDVYEISEMIAPDIHTLSSGGEAAIFIQSVVDEKDETSNLQDVHEVVAAEEYYPESKVEKASVMSPVWLESIRIYIDRIRIYALVHRKQSALIGGVAVLLLTLAVLLVRDRMTQRSSEASAIVAEVTGTIEEKLSDADAVAGVEPARAIKLLGEAKEVVESKMAGLEPGSEEYAQLSALLGRIDAQLDALEGGEQVELVAFFEDPEYLDSVVGTDGSDIFVSSGEKIARLSQAGEIDESGDIGEGVSMLYGIDGAMYGLAASEVLKINTESLSAEQSMDAGGVSVAAFGNNAYLLTGEDIIRSSGGSYFPGGSPLRDATSLTIDGAVYVFENGTILKFLKGKEAEFTLEGLVTKLGEGSSLYTSEVLERLFVLDPENARLVVFEKEGKYETQYNAEELSSATSFAVMGGKVYVATPDGVYTFEL